MAFTQEILNIPESKTEWGDIIKYCPHCGLRFFQRYTSDGYNGFYEFNWHVEAHTRDGNNPATSGIENQEDITYKYVYTPEGRIEVPIDGSSPDGIIPETPADAPAPYVPPPVNEVMVESIPINPAASNEEKISKIIPILGLLAGVLILWKKK